MGGRAVSGPGYVLAPPGTRSRFYDNDQNDPDAPRLLIEYYGPHYGLLRPGDQVVYENPSWQQPDGSYRTGGMDPPLQVDELIDFGADCDCPPQAVLNNGEWECSADNLRAVNPGKELRS